MKNKPLLTIVIPVLNGEKYIADALNSIQNQKQYLEIELIVVDAKSKDRTLEIIERYSSIVDVLISEPDDGQSSALNKAFKIARGEYYMWLGSDDIILNDSFRKLRKILDSGLHKWIAFNTVIISSNMVPIKFFSGITPPKFLQKKCYHFVDSPSSIFHKSIYEKAGPINESLHYAMDVEYWYRIIKSGFTFTRYHEYVYGFRMHDDSKTGSKGYRVTKQPKSLNLKRDAESKFIKAKYDLKTSSTTCSLIIKIMKLRPSKIIDVYKT
jgi:glycosyltransferase involved in cell wall biosynthesis